MSFNIRYGLAEDGENHWERRKSLVIDRIKAFNPDLLGLQECQDDSQAEFVKASLQEYEFLGVARGGDSVTAPELTPILIKKSAFQIRQWETFWLSMTPHIPGSKSWGSVFPRTATWVLLIDPVSGRSLIYVNTHFDYAPSAIQESARFMRKWIDEAVANQPLLITGDFNADKSLLAYQQVTTDTPSLLDVFRAGNVVFDNDGTFHGFGMEIYPQPIDRMRASNQFSILDAEIDRYQENDLFSSDHYPITGTLDWVNPS